VHLNLYAGLVRKTVLFKKCKPRVIREIVTDLTEALYLPGDCICQKGERGDCMYFIIVGSCGIFPDINADQPLMVLNAGEYFGEVSLLTGVKRTAYVRADTFTVLASLTKHVLQPVLRRWPDEIDGILRNVRTQEDREKVRQAAYLHYGIRYADVARDDDNNSVVSQDSLPGLRRSIHSRVADARNRRASTFSVNSTRRKSCLKRDSTSTLASGVTLSALSHANGGVSFILYIYRIPLFRYRRKMLCAELTR